jgi:hypothetical protein
MTASCAILPSPFCPPPLPFPLPLAPFPPRSGPLGPGAAGAVSDALDFAEPLLSGVGFPERVVSVLGNTCVG